MTPQLFVLLTIVIFIWWYLLLLRSEQKDKVRKGICNLLLGTEVSKEHLVSYLGAVEYWYSNASTKNNDNNALLTSMRPVVVCPEMSPPAQSFASVISPISVAPSPGALRWLAPCPPAASCAAWAAALAWAAFPAALALRLREQQRKANARQIRIMKRPARNVKIDDSRKQYHFRVFRHSSCGLMVVVTAGRSPRPSVFDAFDTPSSSDSDILIAILFNLYTYLSL